MPQGVLPYKYEEEKTASGMTALGGLFTYLDLAYVAGLSKSLERNLHIRREQGYSDSQLVMPLVLLNLAGGDCVEDLRILEKDEGFSKILHRIETHGLLRRERRALERRWRKERQRMVPSPSSVFRYLACFHQDGEEGNRQAGKAYIPAPHENLLGLSRVNADLMSFGQKYAPETSATLDLDATLVETNKKEALYCYKHFKAYQPLNVYWTEQELILYSEFRDGNVPASYENLRVLQEAINCLPANVDKVYLRSDTAGYQKELLQYCATGENQKFGVIEFAIGTDVTRAFKEAAGEVKDSEWRPLLKEVHGKLVDTGQEWAEVCYVPTWTVQKNNSPDYRFLAIREPLREQLVLPDLGVVQKSLPFPTMEFNQKKYKLFGLVTNRDLPGDEIIRWHRKRCGKSEEAHSVMKEDLAGGKLPSASFGENAAWWAIMILAFNLNALMKRLVLKGEWVSKRLKAIRFSLINLPGRIIRRAGELIIRLTAGHSSNKILLAARSQIMSLAKVPSG
jgi:hypothetical protein